MAYEVMEHRGLPQYVYGDQRRVRQAVTNVNGMACMRPPIRLERAMSWSGL